MLFDDYEFLPTLPIIHVNRLYGWFVCYGHQKFFFYLPATIELLTTVAHLCQIKKGSRPLIFSISFMHLSRQFSEGVSKYRQPAGTICFPGHFKELQWGTSRHEKGEGEGKPIPLT